MDTKAFIPLKLEPRETYHVIGTEVLEPKYVATGDGLSRELKVTFTNGAVIRMTLPVATAIATPVPVDVSAGPMTA